MENPSDYGKRLQHAADQFKKGIGNNSSDLEPIRNENSGFYKENHGREMDPGFIMKNPGRNMDPGFYMNKPDPKDAVNMISREAKRALSEKDHEDLAKRAGSFTEKDLGDLTLPQLPRDIRGGESVDPANVKPGGGGRGGRH